MNDLRQARVIYTAAASVAAVAMFAMAISLFRALQPDFVSARRWVPIAWAAGVVLIARFVRRSAVRRIHALLPQLPNEALHQTDDLR